ncbi:saccharopine dehydrogenase NADP-binding domain-containing protein [Streptosporangium sp. OZ121]|uniref:saccharopine dehydrogenase NADP-binding domain-containing protein n=1 Tax=Streptosporangium sp. OZ121 TaxID=3444183 RepID=UPI003F7B0462
MRAVGILGCYGAVGRSAVRRLREAGIGPLRLGGRDLGRAGELAERDGPGDGAGRDVRDSGGGAGRNASGRGPADEAVAVDIADAASLAAFCDGCRLVLNCAGPSCVILDTAARAALAAGAHYVDVAGDAAAFDGVSRAARDNPGLVALLSAGMMPGLSALLPRHLAAGFDRPERLRAYTGGLDLFTPAAALDYVASLSGGYATPLAAWRGHQVIPRALRPGMGVRVPHFPGRVDTYPYLAAETERLARELGLAEVEWASVFDGDLTAAALGRLQDMDAEEAAAELVRVSRLEAFGRSPYFQLVFEMSGESGGAAVTRTLLARAADGYELTAAVAAAAVEAVEAGRVPPGPGEAADVLDPGRVFAALLDDPRVTRLEIVEGAAHTAPVEEGVL